MTMNNKQNDKNTNSDLLSGLLTPIIEMMVEALNLLVQFSIKGLEVLIKELVKKYYSEEKADLAQSSFDQIFVKRDNPENMQSRKIDSDVGLLELLTEEGLVASKGEGKRLLSQNAVKINGEVCNDINLIVSPSNEELVIKIGKRRFLKVTS